MRLGQSFTIGLALLALALGYRLRVVGGEAVTAIRTAALKAAEADAIKRGLINRIQDDLPNTSSLYGYDVNTNQEFTDDSIGSMVVFVFGADCPYSIENVEFLNQVHGAGLIAVGLAPEEPKHVVEAFSRDHSVVFPVLADPSGTVPRILPSGVVPVLALFVGGNLEDLWLGGLGEEKEGKLREIYELKPNR